MFDSAELRVHPTGKAILKLGVKSQGQGHETTFAQIVAEELGIPPRGHPRGGGRHRQHALRPRHLRVPLDADRRRRHGAGRARARARRPAADRRPPARGGRRGHRLGRRALRGQGRARPGQDDPGGHLRRLHRPARGHGARPRGRQLLRPAEHDLPVRHLRRRGRDRPRHRPVEAAARRRRRRLRRADQPDDRRGPDHGRPHRGLRHGGDGADHVRRGRQLHRLQLHGLPDPDRVGDAGRSSSTRR